jgi:hypothetical protein
MGGGVVSQAVSSSDIVIELALEFAGYLVAIDSGVQLRSFEALREGGGPFMGREFGGAFFMSFGRTFVLGRMRV